MFSTACTLKNYFIIIKIFSLNMIFSSLYREYHLEKDPTCLHALARAMMGLQSVYGIIPKVYGKGRAAKQLYDFMARYFHQKIFSSLYSGNLKSDHSKSRIFECQISYCLVFIWLTNPDIFVLISKAWVSDPIQNSNHLEPNLFSTIQNLD